VHPYRHTWWRNIQRAEALCCLYEAHLRGLEQAAYAAFVALAEGFSPPGDAAINI
jgi:hypothetical protein